MPCVSVVIPSYNSAKYLPESINSVLGQTIDDLEVIVVDDGSTDNSKEIVCSYNKKVKYLYQSNSGSAAARNLGIRNSSAGFIAFLDSDDYWDGDHLESMLHVIRDNPGVGLVYCDKKWVDATGELLADAPKQTNFPCGWIFQEMFEANYISTSSVVVARKDALLDVGCFCEAQELRNAQDYQLWLRMSSKYEIASTEQKTVNYRRHGSNRTKDEASRQRGLLYALETAVSLLEDGKVDERNTLDKINVRERMRQYFQNAVMSLYCKGYYSVAREFCLLAMKKGYWSRQLSIRLFLTSIPSPLRTAIHSLKHSVIK